jgi:ech hydrogenase subunit E
VKRTILPVGPQHPVLPEPLLLDLVLEDEKVVDAIPGIGYVHRGLESLVEHVEFLEYGTVAERICGICSFMHGWGYCAAVEEVMGLQVPERAELLRVSWAELSRVQSHLLWLGLAADALGFENLFMHCWKLRERVLDIFERTTGGRIIHGACKVGGVRRDVPNQALASIVTSLADLVRDMGLVERVFAQDRSVRHRLSGVGVLAREEALSLGTVGPMARASGLPLDVRSTGHGAYGRLAWEPVVEQAGDCMARCQVRLQEIPQSVDLIRQAVAAMPADGAPVDVKVKGTPTGEVFKRLEQPRGEVVYYLKGNGTKNLARFRARTPTFANLPAMIKLVKGVQLADVPTIILTIDPCISCTER